MCKHQKNIGKYCVIIVQEPMTLKATWSRNRKFLMKTDCKKPCEQNEQDINKFDKPMFNYL